MTSRRAVLASLGGSIASEMIRAPRLLAVPRTFEVHMRSDSSGAVVGFDPVGLQIEPGATLRWVCDANVHTATAYSPVNGNHSLRIPASGRPWSSGYLLPGKTFGVTFTVEGVYDYFCIPHEEAGMVGRLIVGRAVGPGTLPFDYFKVSGKSWLPVPPAAQRAFPSIAEILKRGVVPSPLHFGS